MNDELITPIEEEAEADVTRLAKPNCRHCYGRGIVGYNIEGGKRNEVLCSCVMNRVERLERVATNLEQKQLLNEGAVTGEPV